jgi:hypothetical protein
MDSFVGFKPARVDPASPDLPPFVVRRPNAPRRGTVAARSLRTLVGKDRNHNPPPFAASSVIRPITTEGVPRDVVGVRGDAIPRGVGGT